MGYQKAYEVSERKRVIKIIVYFLAVISLLIVALVGYGVYWAFFDMKRLPEGEFLTEERSPNGEYTVKAYVTNGGATTPYSVRGELVFNEKKNKTKNIYWDSREEKAEIAWKGNHTVVINGHELDVRKDKYDFRRR
ncbi:DUF5412 domain-containing protein [Sporosarcina sp. D27]|uniref:DUF5412 domain-containing protein n=1 Tax=Sporosarcina sp. D27 TaxID=1382305 RepID=UPI00046ECAD5